MQESLLEKANRLGLKPATAPATESLIQKAQRLGIQPTSPTTQPGYLQRVGQSYQQSAQDITKSVENTAQKPSLGNFVSTGLETAGSVARSAFAPITEIPLVKSALSFVSNKVAENPTAKSVITKVSDLAKQYPQQARGLQNIVDIISLGVAPEASSVLKTEGKAVLSDVAQGARVVLTPSEDAVQSKVISLFQKSIKPTAKKTIGQGQKYENDVLSALKTIKSNAENLNIQDATGELVSGRTPQTINELAQGVDQTKKLVFNQYDALAKKAGTNGALIDAKPIAQEVAKVAQNKALQLTNPEIIKYAENWSERLNGLDKLDPETTQEVIKLMNNNLQSFYRNPTYDSASKVAVDAGIANNFREALDKAIEGATGEQYQALKGQYGALKAIENDVVRASMRDARKNVKGLLDYTDMFTGGQMVGGILSLNPAMFTKGAIEKGFKEYIKFVNDPNRAIGNIFEKLGSDVAPEFTPKSTVGKFIKDPKLGASVSNVAKNISLSEKGTIRDFTDYVNGSYKPTGKDLIELKKDAQTIADKYGFSAGTKGDRALSNQFGEYLDSVNYGKKLRK